MFRGRHRHICGLGILVALIYGTVLVMQDSQLLAKVLSARNSLQDPAQEPVLMGQPELSEIVAPHLPYERPESPKEAATDSDSSKAQVHRPIGEGTANATFVILARNSDLEGVLSSMEQVERRFNKRFGYPWVFLNEVEFEEEFKRRVTEATKAPVSFGLIPYDHWFQPDWIDENKARAGREKMQALGIIYADSVPYRNMCRFNSGFFFHHPLLQPYKYYWRVEPGISYTCDIQYDPFDYMRAHNKLYGFTITFTEWEATIPTLWKTVKEFITLHPEYLAENHAMKYLSDNGGELYNLCHFWSNFEIADMDFWRGEAYQKFFDFLESKGGFYYERWGDAPVHSIAVALFASRDQLHFFDDIGYNHPPFEHCPSGEMRAGRNCDCSAPNSIDDRPQSCLSRYKNLW